MRRISLAVVGLVLAAAAASIASPVAGSAGGADTVGGRGTSYDDEFGSTSAEIVAGASSTSADGLGAHGVVKVSGDLGAFGHFTIWVDVECLRVVDNRAMMLGTIFKAESQGPEGFPFPQVGDGHVIGVEDNGPPQNGQSVDRMGSTTFYTGDIERTCALIRPPGVFLVPVDEGNFTVHDGVVN